MHPRFRKEFGGVGRCHMFFTRVEWDACIGVADSAKLAKLIKIVGVLLQKKVYLFWWKDEIHKP